MVVDYRGKVKCINYSYCKLVNYNGEELLFKKRERGKENIYYFLSVVFF